MTSGSTKIMPFPLFDTQPFHREVGTLRRVISRVPPHYPSGSTFLSVIRLALAKLDFADWTSFEGDRLRSRLNLLEESLQTACTFGLQGMDGEVLRNLETRAEIPDEVVVVVGGRRTEVKLSDNNLQLGSSGQLGSLRSCYENMVVDKGEEGKANEGLEAFLQALVDRRAARVMQWLNVNVAAFGEAAQARELVNRAGRMLDDLKLKWRLCDAPRCHACFLPCSLLRGHEDEEHDCCTEHKCRARCEFCEASAAEEGIEEVKDSMVSQSVTCTRHL